MPDGTSEEGLGDFMPTELAPTHHRLGIPYRWAPWWVGVAGTREVGSCQLWFKPRRTQYPRTKPSERAENRENNKNQQTPRVF